MRLERNNILKMLYKFNNIYKLCIISSYNASFHGTVLLIVSKASTGLQNNNKQSKMIHNME